MPGPKACSGLHPGPGTRAEGHGRWRGWASPACRTIGCRCSSPTGGSSACSRTGARLSLATISIARVAASRAPRSLCWSTRYGTGGEMGHRKIPRQHGCGRLQPGFELFLSVFSKRGVDTLCDALTTGIVRLTPLLQTSSARRSAYCCDNPNDFASDILCTVASERMSKTFSESWVQSAEVISRSARHGRLTVIKALGLRSRWTAARRPVV
jgi:hypothetical protein